MTTNEHRQRSAIDRDLVRASGGDRAAIRRCVHALGPIVWSTVRARVRDEREARAHSERIFSRLWRQASEFDPALESAAVFAVRLTRRELAGVAGGRSAAAGAHDRGFGPDAAPERAGAAWAARDLCGEVSRLAPFLDNLSPVQQQLLIATLQRGQSPEAVAAESGRDRSTVRAELRGLLRDAREALISDANRREVSA